MLSHEEKIVNIIKMSLMKKYGVAFLALPKEKQDALIVQEGKEMFEKLRAGE